MRNEPFKLTGETGRSKPDTATAAAQVAAARQAQQQRQQCLNAHLDLAGIQQHCALSDADGQWLEQAVERLGLSRRASHRVLKVARTLADLAGSPNLERAHLAEALQYRQLDRQPQNGQTPG